MNVRDGKLVALLRRIALGLPVAVGPLVLGAASGGCTHCYSFPAGLTSHPRGVITETFVGTPESFDPTGCNALCRALDGLDALDASVDGGDDDAGMRTGGLSSGSLLNPGRLRATCGYQDAATLSCTYTEQFCETNASCSPTIYGRVPMGLVADRSPAGSAVSRWLADGAHLEAASVLAFVDLANELDSFAAPTALVRAARRGADDERRHARSLRGLAHRLAAPVAAVRRTETAPRRPEEVALDNAAEGCAREAYGALAAAFQAEHAASRSVRVTYRRIAADEARHALLSFAANEWLAPRLSRAARRRAEEERRRALADLAAALSDEPESTVRRVVGLPDATRSMDLLSLLS